MRSASLVHLESYLIKPGLFGGFHMTGGGLTSLNSARETLNSGIYSSDEGFITGHWEVIDSTWWQESG